MVGSTVQTFSHHSERQPYALKASEPAMRMVGFGICLWRPM